VSEAAKWGFAAIAAERRTSVLARFSSQIDIKENPAAGPYARGISALRHESTVLAFTSPPREAQIVRANIWPTTLTYSRSAIRYDCYFSLGVDNHSIIRGRSYRKCLDSGGAHSGLSPLSPRNVDKGQISTFAAPRGRPRYDGIEAKMPFIRDGRATADLTLRLSTRLMTSEVTHEKLFETGFAERAVVVGCAGLRAFCARNRVFKSWHRNCDQRSSATHLYTVRRLGRNAKVSGRLNACPSVPCLSPRRRTPLRPHYRPGLISRSTTRSRLLFTA
jgi:hypothetical protein